MVDYVEWNDHQTNEQYLSNPMLYTYLKDAVAFSDEKELRISLSAIGIGQFALNDGSIVSTSVQLVPRCTPPCNSTNPTLTHLAVL
ncbi:MAG: hypothetical protein IPP36_02760 [Nitrosomonadales bacterium]|nr:hypothetical protein [Nitrosomonadales bacterium]